MEWGSGRYKDLKPASSYTMRQTCPRCAVRLLTSGSLWSMPDRLPSSTSTPTALVSSTPLTRIRSIRTKPALVRRTPASPEHSIVDDQQPPPSTFTEHPTPIKTEDTVRSEAVAEQVTPARINTASDHDWLELGIPPILLEKLRAQYPAIHGPTPAQRAFLLSVLRGLDVFMRDSTGRGKTLALSIAALTLAAALAEPGATRVLILVPTAHLAQQIAEHLSLLDPTSTSNGASWAILNPTREAPRTPLVLATPRDMIEVADFASIYKDVTTIFLDEPDSMIGPLPAKHTPERDLAKHPLNRRPPHFIPVINGLLGLKASQADSTGHVEIEFQDRKEIQTVWTSATITSALRRLIKNRGWIRREDLESSTRTVMSFDFSPHATPEQKQVAARFVSAEVHSTVPPEHFVITVDPATGTMQTLDPEAPPHAVTRSEQRKGQIDPLLLESLALLYATSPPPEGKHVLAVPPEGISLDKLVADLASVGVDAVVLHPDTVTDLPPSSVLVARRSTVPGLHLPTLHTVYLLDGLDFAGMSAGQRKTSMGRRERMRFYDVLAGRLGRLGATLDRQNIVTLVMRGTEEETRMRELFFGNKGSGITDDGERVLAKWSGDDLKRTIEDAVD
ncbi:hypothetical protein BCR39DRAFT_217976 [Naematelia encephala]|uniref:ATP-dependent RNA helicase n=1 Tax=Naematelia encephala TaxID=71784 RepID=A0A1Y2AZ30_9TREE|nr:hypothetical protein BCR39DRAFT_217976 [Naematelia encephala]